LTLTPEFIYLRDQFGWRMNTIFKFYFQTWIVWGIAAAYSSAVLWQQIKSKVWVNVFRLVLLVVLAAGLAYPFWGVYDRLSHVRPADLTLDGTNFIARSNPDEMAAILWLRQAPYGVVAEAIGGQYSSFGRMATYSGLPTVLGWAGHEGQWGRGPKELGDRDPDIQLLYKTSSWKDAQHIIDKYQIRYIVVGDLERSAYRVSDQKFKNTLKAVFQSASVTIYEAPDEATAIAAGIP